jgi:hypothetical protein
MLLGGLEDQVDGAGEPALGGQDKPGAEDHGHVPVVTAGVHDAVVPRSVRPVAAFGERQAVHVGAQGDGVAEASVVGSVEGGDQAGAADATGEVEAHGLQPGGQVVARAVLLQAGLRDLVQVMAPASQPRPELFAHAVRPVTAAPSAEGSTLHGQRRPR